VTAPAEVQTDANTPVTFDAGTASEVSVADVDAGTGRLRVILTAAKGKLTLATVAGLRFSTGDGTADRKMVFGGSLDAVNAALDGASFRPTPGFVGAARLSITVSDQGNTGAGGPGTDAASTTIDVV
jgi:hypothetical protein